MENVLTDKQFKAVEKKSIVELLAQVNNFTPEAPVWKMLKPAANIPRSELTVHDNGTFNSFSTEDLEDDWAEKNKQRFYVKGDGAMVAVGIVIAMRDWTPDPVKMPKAKPIKAGDLRFMGLAR